MRIRRVKPADSRGDGPSRRDVLRAAAGLALGTIPAAVVGHGPEPPRPAAGATPSPADCPWWLGPEYPRSRVVEIRDARVLADVRVNEPILADMVHLGLRVLTGASTVAEALQRVLGRARRVLLKFNQVGATAIGTNEAVARILVATLADAGYDPETITLVEAPEGLAGELKTGLPVTGWGPPIHVGGRPEEVVKYVYESDAIINVPFLKVHPLAGMSGAMKNLSHAVIRHPARYHDHGCSPCIGQVVSSKALSSRLKLTVVNALRVIVRPDADATGGDLANIGQLLFGFDPVALDTVGLELLLKLRRNLGLAADLSVPSLTAAAETGAGRNAAYGIDRIPVTLGS